MPIALQVFLEAVASGFMIPLSSDVMLSALKIFHRPELSLAVPVAIAGAMAAQALNWGIGKLLLHLKREEKIFVSDELYNWANYWGQRWLLVLLLFSFVDFGALLVVAAAFFNVSLKRALPVIFISQVGFYVYLAYG